MFGKLFGNNTKNNKKESAPDLNITLQKLRQTTQLLEKREQHLKQRIEEFTAQALQKSKRRDKKGALQILKKRKITETQLESIQKKILNLEAQMNALEEVVINKETMRAMKTASVTMRAAISDKEVEEVADLMDEMNENTDRVQEMNEIMSQPLGPQMDEDELEQELAELENMDTEDIIAPIISKKEKVKKEKVKIKEVEKEEEEEEEEQEEETVSEDEVPHKISKKAEQDELAELEAMTS